MSETVRTSWWEVYNLNAITFLNLICYCKDKAAEKNRQIEEWKRKN